ncbi:Pimeloyl-ACP methyl ester carboxylesterase [Streptomyces sp. 1222.5]|uniref:alpha/beta fold hydrolase n=1 Tax=unclassified Streptomyces TaxID=2593676 RepID=UPI000898D536|nr:MULTISPECIES: alpha/beta hydrolase [unclassified Streptomyces]PKW09253.1 pimeloyl-ACP methyl ester carboxylesterase [Streptomyces sp. 5112.2]SEC40421.1 Pimeloyl-ACP methyl ester carboxylesterase [Streptomyces sp. 1222.5]SED50395.1 Pimeloyl-ACP methyl ester carboxylesterase [Streptomyces sp. 2231.1]
MARRIDVTGAGGVRLAAWDFAEPPKAQPHEAGRDPAGPGHGTPGVLLLHGLMGRASHWAAVARRLAGRHRAVALDQRGHGRSDKPPQAAYTREAYVEDAEAAVEQLGLAPAVLIGHAMGALTAWQLAAKRPDLVRGVIIFDMRASALGAASQRDWADWFRAWPVPFATLADVRKWFGEDDPWVERPDPARGAFYAEVMHEREDGWHPVFDPERMLRSRETWVYDAHWEELAQVRCPALVVRALDGELGRAEAQEMVRVLPRGEYAEVVDAGHLAHYDHPEGWRSVVEPFLDSLAGD